MPTGQRIGYIRVSSADQNPARQLEGVSVDKVFTDYASGKSTDRPQWHALLEYAREGDTIVAHSMDRLARNLDDLRRIVREQTARGIALEFVHEHLTFTGDDSPMATLLLSMMGAFAEFERAIIRERQREGIALAKQRGVYKGRKPKLTPRHLPDIQARLAAGEPKAAIARALGIDRKSLYRFLARVAHERNE